MGARHKAMLHQLVICTVFILASPKLTAFRSARNAKPLLHHCMEKHFLHLRIHVCLVLTAIAIFVCQSAHVNALVQTLSMTHT